MAADQADEGSVEVVVVGAGFAGLAAAQVLGRAQREVLVLGIGPTRNAEATQAHNVLTRDGTPPGELLALGLAEVEALPCVTVRDAHVDVIEPGRGEGLRVRLADGSAVDAEIVVLATGARDRLPEVPGLPELWGRRAHSCPFCDGEAYAGRRLLLVADEGPSAHMRMMLAGWTDDLNLVAPGDIARLVEDGSDVVAHLHDFDPDASPAEFWDAHYGQSEQIWSGAPNGRLVEAVEGLAPGRALDVGCGEGGDAVWLAQQGWQVTAADVSATAMARGAAAAAAAGVADRIDWQRHDLADTFPEGTYDLVNAAYVLSPLELPRADILLAASRAVAPGGTLVLLGHCGVPPWMATPPDLHFPTPEEELALLDLAEGEWVVAAMGTYDRPMTAPDGTVGARTDTVVHVRRLAG